MPDSASILRCAVLRSPSARVFPGIIIQYRNGVILDFAIILSQFDLEPRRTVFVNDGYRYDWLFRQDAFNRVCRPASVIEAVAEFPCTLRKVGYRNREQTNTITNAKFRAVGQA